MKIIAQLFGQKMTLYQITSNSGISIITGQDIIKAKIHNDEINELKAGFKSVKNLIKEKRNFKKITEEEYPSILNRIINRIKQNR